MVEAGIKKFFFLGLTAAMSVACGEETGNSVGGDGGPTTIARDAIGAEGGTVSSDGATVTVPAGALSSDVMLEATRLDAASIAALPAAENEDFDAPATLTDGVYVFTPHGTSFSMPATVELAYTGEANVVLRLDDESDTTWEIVGDAVVENGTASFTTTTFSVYAVASAMLNCQRQFCLSLTSQSGGAECGVVDDNCGGQVDLIQDCGFPECGEGRGCNESNKCEAGCVSDFNCNTTTAQCGTLVDSCGNERDVVAECENINGCGELGSCTDLNLCGACTPYADCAAALEATSQSCGEVSDGCGGTLDCTQGVCPNEGESCIYIFDEFAANGEGYNGCRQPCASADSCPPGDSGCDGSKFWFTGCSCNANGAGQSYCDCVYGEQDCSGTSCTVQGCAPI